MQNIGSDEFFIYVPSKQEAEALIEKNFKSEAVDNEAQDWVKIPLAGPFVVYARLQDESKHRQQLSC